ncbi:MAG: hypothetical protein JF589_04070 [Gemmatimonadetes bacterium]|nr:hypothetical protein [Gemmatimonadota bacterium]
MSETPSPPRRSEWWARPRVVLPVVGALVVLVALITPQPDAGRAGDPRLSTHTAGALGARLLYETAERLGWQVSRREEQAAPERGDGRTIHAVLAPVVAITPQEAHAYLEAVRAGDGLLLVLNTRNALADSLGVTHTNAGGTMETVAADVTTCPSGPELIPPLWLDGKVHLWTLVWKRDPPQAPTMFVTAVADAPFTGTPAKVPAGKTVTGSAAAAGYPLGRGRVVVVADPDLFRNDVIRRCGWGADVRAVRILEWLRDGGDAPRRTIVFDEYHQGFGHMANMVDTTRDFLVQHPLGRTLLQIVLAALVLLLALGPRPIPPVDVLRVERRDPLEQIDALAHAYEQVHATRTMTARLLRGVRSRVERTWSDTRARPNEAFLADALSRAPALASDVELVQHALDTPVPDRTLPELGAALRRIEQTLTTTPSA